MAGIWPDRHLGARIAKHVGLLCRTMISKRVASLSQCVPACMTAVVTAGKDDPHGADGRGRSFEGGVRPMLPGTCSMHYFARGWQRHVGWKQP